MRILLLTLAILLGYATAPFDTPSGEDGAKAEYIGGTATLPGRADGSIRTTDSEFLEFQMKRAEVRVPYDRINLLEYGQKVNRRYALAVLVSPVLLLSKKRQHYLTIGYSDAEGRQQALVFKIEKGRIRSVLVALEARTGLKVQFQDDEARKAGKG